jgi:mRNA interferase RelE/StbE
MIDSPRWRVIVSPAVKKRLAKLERPERERIIQALIDLGQDPFGLDVKPLRGRPEWRLRVGPWRILLRVDKANLAIVALTLGSRGDVYKK